MRAILFILAGFMLFMSCKNSETKKIAVDKIFINATVYTVDAEFSKAQSFAIRGDKFVAVGLTDSIQAKYQATETIDLQGKIVYPGFIDAHCHFFGFGASLQSVDLAGTTSFDEVVQRVQEFNNQKPSDFIYGRGWDQNDWESKEFPDKKKLDSLYPDIPVVLERIDGHAYLVNQKTLDLAKIDNTTVTEGGEIVKTGKNLTGVLIDNPMELVTAVMPKMTGKQGVSALQDAQEYCFNYGLTTVNDAGLDRETIFLIDSLQQAGGLDMRIYAMISNTPEDVDYFIEKGILKTDKLNVRSVKVYGDGALGSRGAALREPYSDRAGHYGAMVTPVDSIYSLAKKLAATNFQMNTHAIGDSANTVILKAYAEALKDQSDRRWKIEHAQVISPEDFNYFDENILPSVQPTHATSDMYWAKDRLGERRMKGAYAYKKLLNEAGIIALGTDFPVEKVNPFYTFYAAVARKDLMHYPEGGFQMKDALSREETLRGMTIWAAYSNFEENEKGSIEPGKFADFIVMDEDLMTVDEDAIPNLEVSQTWLGGKQVK
ncbi:MULTISPECIES: amidohydrolase [unclassified Leeuwenhoekiella]|uniref:amidohydrolase n=1 Tax=unclassified Leeuwenhoekiella TaxID=2615029 RepID=UPI000C559A09|nr:MULTISPECIES: amidohydrolase [unclassified Leeuwenhoekiella]MAW94138.1 amidohydrolase [Leeuwenhoekiella sp.]MBA82435.1 amidohydrolase [Leeuwenhoekiella sp.]|tara:strand:+ start:42544 stop:44178 length:1635 start_codon:yes stop_codon:yes gene_type:complete